MGNTPVAQWQGTSKHRRSPLGLTMTALIVGSVLSSSGCDMLNGIQDRQNDDDSSSSSHEVQDSQLRVLLTDAPLDVDHVYVTISEIRVHSCASKDEIDEETSVEDSNLNETNKGDEPSTVDDSNANRSRDEMTEDESNLDDQNLGTIQEESKASEDEAITRKTVASSPQEDRPDQDRRDAGSKGSECQDGTWRTVVEEEKTLDLLALQNGLTEEMGLAVLPAGNYGQIRLMLDQASVVVNGETFPLSIPSGVQSGIKIQHRFHLSAGEETVLTLDFDASQSVHHAPGKGWIMRPVIKVIDVDQDPLSSSEESPSTDDSYENNESEESSKEENTPQPQDPGKGKP